MEPIFENFFSVLNTLALLYLNHQYALTYEVPDFISFIYMLIIDWFIHC